jgi:hypothetical protein
MKIPGQQPPLPFDPPLESPTPLGPVFHVGLEEYSTEYVSGEKRYFEWQLSSDDENLSKLAGWAAMPFDLVPGENAQYGRLEMPTSLRSASSALGGVEAFEGEKKDIIDFIVTYTHSVYDSFRAADTSLQLDTIGVSRGNEEILVVPPHRLETNRETIVDWYLNMQADIETVLENEPNRDELLNTFHAGLSFLERAL